MSTVVEQEGFDPQFTGWIAEKDQEDEWAQDNPMMMSMGDISINEPLPLVEEQCRKMMEERYGTEEGWDFTLAEEKVYGDILWTQQPNGNCVGSSGSIAVSSRYAYEVWVAGQLETLFGDAVWGKTSGIVFIPYSYGAGRYEGGFSGRGDGSTCQGQLKGFKEWGFIPCYLDQLQQYGNGENFPQSTSSVNKDFGRNKDEISKFKDIGNQNALENSAVIEDLDHLEECMVTKKMPVMQASNWGFAATNKKTPWGDPVYDRRGSWSHQMSWRKFLKDKQGKRWTWVGNQWGQNNHSGQCGFWLDERTSANYIQACHAVAIGELKGTPEPPPKFNQ